MSFLKPKEFVKKTAENALGKTTDQLTQEAQKSEQDQALAAFTAEVNSSILSEPQKGNILSGLTGSASDIEARRNRLNILSSGIAAKNDFVNRSITQARIAPGRSGTILSRKPGLLG